MSAKHIWALVSGLPSGPRERRLLLMLQAYVDESYGGDPAIYAMAGFVSTAEKWAAFSDAWRRVLDIGPRIESFKMSEAMALQGQFAGWLPELRDEKLRLLIEVIADHAIVGLGVALPLKAYTAVFKDTFLPKPLWRPYFFLLHGIIAKFAQVQHEYGLTEKIDFIFDEQVSEKHAIIKNWEIFKRANVAPAHLIGSTPSFKTDRDHLPLQAADIHAWVLRENGRRSMRGEPFVPLPKPSKGRKNPPSHVFTWDEDQLRALWKGVNEKIGLYPLRLHLATSFPAWDPNLVSTWDGQSS